MGDLSINETDEVIIAGADGIDRMIVNTDGTTNVRIKDSSGNSITEGQKTMASSLPVVLASDQPAISVLTGGVGTAIKHINGTATVTPATITFGLTSVSFLIHNLGSNNLYVSFDGGTLYKVIDINSVLSQDVRMTGFMIKTLTSTTSYEILVIY